MTSKAETYYNKALKNQKSENYNEAIILYEKSLEIHSNAKARNNLGYCFQAIGNYDKAEEVFNKAISDNDAYLETYFNLSLINIAKDRPDEAFKYLMQPFKKGNDLKIDMNSEIWRRSSGYVMIALNLIVKKFKRLNKIHLDILKFLHSDPEIRTKDIRVALSFYTDATVSKFNQINNQEEKNILQDLAEDNLILSYLYDEVNSGLITENFFIDLRTRISKSVAKKDFNKETKNNIQIILKALVMQSLNSEYIWSITKKDYENINLIEKRVLKNIDNKNEIEIIDLLALMSYEEISSYKRIYKYLKELPKNTYVELEKIFQKEIYNREDEKILSKDINQISSINNTFSKKVKDQYEENPYPRWIGLKNVASNIDMSTGKYYDNYLKVVTQNLPIKPKKLPSDKNSRILIAGCGTGLQPISIATADKNVIIDAFDLSLKSISYGMRMAEELKINNINWFQADILDLSELKNSYDIIECSGVLHHMKDPKKGFNELEKKLKSFGFMKLGLYAKHFRDGRLKKIRKKAKNENYTTDLNSIRKLRDFIKKTDDEDIKVIGNIHDFYSSSNFRDLVLHVHESNFTIPELKNMCRIGKDYTFLGWEFPREMFNRVVATYLSNFPEDIKRDNLDNWNKFEENNPDLFAAMYQFWLQKK